MGALGLGDRLEVEAALDSAFEPLRTRRSSVGPTRVRAAVRWGRAEPPVPVPWAAAIRRLSELGVAAGVSAFVFVSALAAPPAPPPPLPIHQVEVVQGVLDMPVQERPLEWPFFVPGEAIQQMVTDIKRELLVPISDEIDGNALDDSNIGDRFELPTGPAPFLRIR